MATKSERFRYQVERSGPDKPKSPRRPRRDLWVDTSKPGTSATDRKVGAGHSAERNYSNRAARQGTYVLEDSAGQPSRKSTRKSGNRIKASPQLRRSRMRSLQRRA